PEAMVPVVSRLGQTTDTFIAVEPNAGLPVHRNGETLYLTGAEEVAKFAPSFVEAGANIIGGCCGTTPEYIRILSKTVKGTSPISRPTPSLLKISSRTSMTLIGDGVPFLIVGEKINPTGKKIFSEAIANGQVDLIVAEARKEAEAGAGALDVNVGVPLVNEAEMMAKAITAIQNVVSLPLVIDSSYASALESGLKLYPGRALVNSVNAEDERLEEVLPLIRKYGAAVIALVSGDNIPETAAERMKNAEKILRRAEELGLKPRDLIFDTLALTVSAVQEAAKQTLDTITLIKKELRLPTILGLSNVSFGLPARKIVHNNFLSMAIGAGLDAAICDPYDQVLHQTIAASSLFARRDPDCRIYLNKAAAWTPTQANQPASKEAAPKTTSEAIRQAILEGERDGIAALCQKGLDEGLSAFTIFLDIMTPAIRHLGDLFGQRVKFIPHLIAGADAMKKGVEVLQPYLEADGPVEPKGCVVFATVKGDIHDIGKNICILMLRNFGFSVIDLGRNVPLDDILAAAEKHQAQIIALSALMTTTMMQMKTAIETIREKNLPYKVMVGGAVVTPKFSTEIKADGYGKDVGDVVPLAEKLIAAFSGLDVPVA
ncbi:MAG: dihydropteroate synthase, partial [Nitrospiraceae bacterium]|nr:dihydropteroate synthase [Nitrospiraceae bacterium]